MPVNYYPRIRRKRLPIYVFGVVYMFIMSAAHSVREFHAFHEFRAAARTLGTRKANVIVPWTVPVHATQFLLCICIVFI